MYVATREWIVTMIITSQLWNSTLSVNWKLKQKKQIKKTIRFNEKKSEGPITTTNLLIEIANNFREIKITTYAIKTTWTMIKDTISRASKNLQENYRKYINQWSDTTCQEVIKNHKRNRAQMLQDTTQEKLQIYKEAKNIVNS